MSGTRPTTLDQRRAQHAWGCAQRRGSDAYAKLAKGLPALIMNSGLLQVLSFLQEKGDSSSQAHCRMLGDDLRAWLSAQLRLPGDFGPFFERLMAAEPQLYQHATAEAFAWLRWLRQLASVASSGAR